MQTAKYSSATSCLKEILKTEGPKALYRGVSSILVMVPFRNSFYLSLYTSIKHRTNTKNHFWKGFIPGSITGVILTVFTCPAEKVKCTMQVPNEYSSSADCLKKMYRKEGFQGLMRGFNITVLRDFIWFGVFFGIYESIKAKIHEKGWDYTWWGWIACGSISGMCCWVIILPIDFVKTRFQLSKENYWFVTKDIVRTSGFFVLWTGLASCIMRSFITNGVGFFCYECIKTNLPKVIPI